MRDKELRTSSSKVPAKLARPDALSLCLPGNKREMIERDSPFSNPQLALTTFESFKCSVTRDSHAVLFQPEQRRDAFERVGRRR